MKQTAFDIYHPAVAAVYLTAALVFTMATFQPIFVVLSFAVAFAYNVFLRGWRAALKTAAWQVPLLLVVAILNGVVSARGSTLLFKIGHQGFYLESFLYGFFMGLSLLAVLQWFSNLSCILTSDKVMQLTGSTMPTVGLMMTMMLRLVPQYLRRGAAIHSTQKACTAANFCASAGECPDKERKRRGFFARKAESARSGLRDISVLMGWGMEDSLDASDAMRARGWGAVRKRSTYRRAEFRVRDGVLLAVLAVLIIVSACLAWIACSQSGFYPRFSFPMFWWGYLPYLLFLITPFVLELKERIVWRK